MREDSLPKNLLSTRLHPLSQPLEFLASCLCFAAPRHLAGARSACSRETDRGLPRYATLGPRHCPTATANYRLFARTRLRSPAKPRLVKELMSSNRSNDFP